MFHNPLGIKKGVYNFCRRGFETKKAPLPLNMPDGQKGGRGGAFEMFSFTNSHGTEDNPNLQTRLERITTVPHHHGLHQTLS